MLEELYQGWEELYQGWEAHRMQWGRGEFLENSLLPWMLTIPLRLVMV